MECMYGLWVLESVDIKFNNRFLLAQLYITSLADEPTERDFEQALQNLPTGLDKAYEQAMERIESQGEKRKKLAKKVLSWAVCSERNLSISELQHAVAVQSGKPDLDRKKIPRVEIIGSICAGLITIDTQSDVVQLVHYTTQEYFDKTWKDWFPNAETDITMTCVTYLSFQTFESGFCETDEEFEERHQLYPLYNYAANNWGHHARTASLEIEQSILDLLLSEAKVSAFVQALMAGTDRRSSGYSRRVPPQVTGVYLAAYFGLTGVITALLKIGHHPNIRDDWGRTPLTWAAEQGHEAVVKLLLEKGAEVNSKEDIYGQTPLSWAEKNGHKAVVKLLLEKGAEVDSKDNEYGQPPLKRAANNEYGQTPLIRAAKNGHEAVVKLLLEKGAKVESQDDIYGQTPLSWAAKNGHKAVVKLLLEKGTKVDSKSDNGQTPLLWAAENRHKAVVKLLLNKGAELDSKGILGKTALS